MKRIMIFFAVIVSVTSVIILIKYREEILYIVELFNYDPYKYHVCYSKNCDSCITIITYSPLSMGDNPSKKYIIDGDRKLKLPLKEVEYIEYPNDTNIVVLWGNENQCTIISNNDPIVSRQISEKFQIILISNNQSFEYYSMKYPKSTF